MNRTRIQPGYSGASTRKNAGIFFLVSVLLIAGCSRGEALLTPTSGIAFVSDRDGNWEIYIVQLEGSGLARLTENTTVDADPGWSPDGKQIAFRSRRDGSSDLFIMAADGSRSQNIIGDPEDSFDDEFAPAWNPDGEMIALYTDRFPPAPECPSGVHRLALFPNGGRRADIQLLNVPPGEQETSSWSPDGRFLAYSSGCRGAEAQIFIWERDSGQTRPLTQEPDHQTSPDWSHDGRFLAFVSNREGNSEIYKFEFATGGLKNLTQHPALDTHPTWSPGDSFISFVSNRDGNQEIYVMAADGSESRNLTNHPARDWAPDWSPIP